MKMAFNLSSNKTNSDRIISILETIGSQISHLSEACIYGYTTICIFWMIYVTYQIYWQMLQKRLLLENRCREDASSLQPKIFSRDEAKVRYLIFIVFLLFELVFCITTINDFLSDHYGDPVTISERIGANCTLHSDTFIGSLYDFRGNSVFLTINMYFLELSYSMMVWMFGASLLHLSYAARNEIKTKNICKFFLVGFVFKAIIILFKAIPYTGLFGEILQNLTDVCIFFVVLCIAKRKFFPAMHSRVKEAFNIYGIRGYYEQKQFLKNYRRISTFLMTTFGIFALKSIFLNSGFVLIESISEDSCWFHATYGFPKFTIPKSIKNEFLLIEEYLLLLANLLDFVTYFNFVVVNIVCIYIVVRKYITQTLIKPRCYRYRLCYYEASLSRKMI